MKQLLINEYNLLTQRSNCLGDQAKTLPMPNRVNEPTLSSIANTGRLIQTLQQLHSARDETKYVNEPQYRSDACAREEAIITGRIDILDEAVGDEEAAHSYVEDEYCTLAATIDTLRVIRDLYET